MVLAAQAGAAVPSPVSPVPVPQITKSVRGGVTSVVMVAVFIPFWVVKALLFAVLTA